MKVEMKTVLATLFVAVAVAIPLIGCNQATDTQIAKGPTSEGLQYLLSTEPEGAQEVATLRESAQDAEEVLVVGRIGGSTNPWSEGMAAFEIVDRSLKACSDIEGDNCETPWDYCCERTKLPKSKILVKVVNEQGNVVPSGAKQLLALEELQTVVVRGTAKQDEAGNVSILANGIYVKK